MHFQLWRNRDNSSIIFLFERDKMNSCPMRWNARTSKQKWEQVNLRNFQGVKVQISGILIPDIILIPSYTYRMLNPNSKIKASRVPCHTYFLACQGLIVSNEHIAQCTPFHSLYVFTKFVIYKNSAIFNRIFQFVFKCRLKLFLFNTKKICAWLSKCFIQS